MWQNLPFLWDQSGTQKSPLPLGAPCVALAQVRWLAHQGRRAPGSLARNPVAAPSPCVGPQPAWASAWAVKGRPSSAFTPSCWITSARREQRKGPHPVAPARATARLIMRQREGDDAPPDPGNTLRLLCFGCPPALPHGQRKCPPAPCGGRSRFTLGFVWSCGCSVLVHHA